MKCKKCGFETPQNSNYCAHCGEPVDFDDAFGTASSFSSPVEEEVKQDKPDKKYFNRYKEENLANTRASVGWFYLGFFCPIAGFVLFYIYCYKRPDMAWKCRRGAVYGIIFDILVFLIEIIFTRLR